MFVVLDVSFVFDTIFVDSLLRVLNNFATSFGLYSPWYETSFLIQFVSVDISEIRADSLNCLAVQNSTCCLPFTV